MKMIIEVMHPIIFCTHVQTKYIAGLTFSLAFMEALTIYGLDAALVLTFANPFD
jgi:hypothetical protein